MTIPISGIIPTYNRVSVLKRTLQSIAKQSLQPFEIIIIDASDDNKTKELCEAGIAQIESKLIWVSATQKGAASQRNQGVNLANCPYIFFLDDDIILEPNCIEMLWNTISSNEIVGGVNATITNQKFTNPGLPTRIMYRLMYGKKLDSYAGKCIGPAWNLLADDNDALPDNVEVDWLHIGCTIYRKEALPNPVFSSHFTGYSMFEDVTISLTVAKNFRLINVRKARIFHDSQPGAHKNNVFILSKMELTNRHYVMKNILYRKRFTDYLKLFLFEVFMLASQFKTFKSLKYVPSIILGKIAAIFKIIKSESKH